MGKMKTIFSNQTIKGKTTGITTPPRIWLSCPHLGGMEIHFVDDAFNSNWIAPLGPHVDGFEADLERYLGGGYVTAVSSGTAAIHLALIILGIKPGDEVICQDMTFSASANPIVYQGATPVFIDSERETWNMSPQLLEEAIIARMRLGKKPKAIISVDLYGMPAKMDEITEIAARYDIPVIEDAAEALGSGIRGKMCGTFGQFGVLSFNGNKVITTSGGGALLSANKEWIQKARFLATQARDKVPFYQHSEIGYNYRMSNVLAAIGRGQMLVLNNRIETRRFNCELYREYFDSLIIHGYEVKFQPEPEGWHSNRWLTTVLTCPFNNKGITPEKIRLALEEQNIESRPLWKPMHLQPVFSGAPFYGNGTSENLFENGLCLPSGSNLTIIEFERIFMALNKIFRKKHVSEFIFAWQESKLTHEQKHKITNECLHNYAEEKEATPVNHWINGELQTKLIRKINIEDLLGREPIQLDHQRIEAGLKDMVVLVTGAAGSIGSEIVQQLITYPVRKVILLDKAESDLFNLQQEIISREKHADFEAIICDVTNLARLRGVFKMYKPDIVYHAAAYKHVPLMEEFPGEAIRTNVGGTKNLADLSIDAGVKKFVLISTDKAVNPSNVMGATKRIGEIYIQSLAQSGKYATKFVTTRFGNVLGSNGSVVPLFEKQIQRGGPVTVTHAEVTRYFMTIPEACQLVLEAGFMGHGGEIFVFDMGKPIRIYDLAYKMILLSGFIPEKEIKIEVTGLRPGEKLYEELLDNKEELLPTYNKKILIAKVREYDEESVNRQVNGILNLVDEKNNCQLVAQIKAIVPEFVPMNSFYSSYIKDHDPATLLLKMVKLLKQFPVQDVKISEVKTPRSVTNPVYANSLWQLNQHEFAMQVEGVGSYYACNGNEIEYAPAEGALHELVVLYLYGSVYGAILHQRKILPLHGSSFIWNEQGVALCGDSGAGKSAITASFCLNGAQFLTDDVTPIVFDGGMPGITPLSDRIKLCHDSLQQLNQEKSELAAVYAGNEKFYLPMEKSKQENYPLKWLFIIEPSEVKDIEVDVLRGVDSFTAVRNEVYRWEYLPAMKESETCYFEKLLDICRTIHVVKIKRPFQIPIENMIGFLQKQMVKAC